MDRGSFSVEVILSLLGFKVLYPDHFYMSRGKRVTFTLNSNADILEKALQLPWAGLEPTTMQYYRLSMYYTGNIISYLWFFLFPFSFFFLPPCAINVNFHVH